MSERLKVKQQGGDWCASLDGYITGVGHGKTAAEAIRNAEMDQQLRTQASFDRFQDDLRNGRSYLNDPTSN